MISRGAKGKGKDAGKTGKVGSPPAKTGAKKGVSTPKGGNGSTAPVSPEGFDAKAFLEDLEVSIGGIVTRIVTEKVNEAVSEINARIDAQDELNVKMISVFHDLMVQTKGTMSTYTDEDGEEQEIGEIYNEEGRFLAYVPGDEEVAEGEG